MNLAKKIIILISIVLIGVFVLVGCIKPFAHFSQDSLGVDVSSNSLSSFSAGVSNEDDIFYKVTFRTDTSQSFQEIYKTVLRSDDLPIPTRAGYTFEGWFVNRDFLGTSVNKQLPYMLDKDVILYAKWIKDDVIRISTVEGLDLIRKNLDGNYALANNIDLSGYSYIDPEKKAINSWLPIAGFRQSIDKNGKTQFDNEGEFTGSFDGNGYTIYNMQIKDIVPDLQSFQFLPVGLFAQVSGEVKNVKLENFSITLDGDLARFYVGGVVGHLLEKRDSQDRLVQSGRIINSHAYGIISNPKFDYEKKFLDSFYNNKKPTSDVDMGLIVGRIEGEGSLVSDCTSMGIIESESHAREIFAGGIAGRIVKGDLEYSNSSAFIKAQHAGGLVGYNDGSIFKCYATGDVEASTSYPGVVGGLVATNYPLGTIDQCYAEGDVKARYAGGLVGLNIFDYAIATGGTIRNCYAIGDVEASEYAGGLIARALGKNPINGYKGYSDIVRPPVTDLVHGEITHRSIESCLAFGNVSAIAERTRFLNDLGEEQVAEGVFFETFAGGLIADAQEVLIKGCMAFGNVEALSKRVISESSLEVYNVVYANNVIGYSTRMTGIEASIKYRVYGSELQEVFRNETEFLGNLQTSDTLDPTNLNFADSLRLTLDLNPSYWNLTDINIEDGRYPQLDMS